MRAAGSFDVRLTPTPPRPRRRRRAGGRGSFVLQHSGTMTRGAPQLLITVVPDSGTDQLEGLSGTMAIEVEGGRHSYVFDYALPGATS